MELTGPIGVILAAVVTFVGTVIGAVLVFRTKTRELEFTRNKERIGKLEEFRDAITAVCEREEALRESVMGIPEHSAITDKSSPFDEAGELFSKYGHYLTRRSRKAILRHIRGQGSNMQLIRSRRNRHRAIVMQLPHVVEYHVREDLNRIYR
jgi:hypothetical protein